MAEAFPNATTIRAGTFDDYFEQLQAPAVRSKLPVVTAGVEDTWLYGCGASHASSLSLAPLHAKNGRSKRCCCRLAGSDPLKVQTMKLLQRHHDSCAAETACVKAEPGWTAFQRLLLLGGKHTCASHGEVLALFCSIARQRGGVGQGAAIRLLKTTDLPRTPHTTPPRSSGKYAGPRPAS